MTQPSAATVLVFTLGPDADRSRRRLLAERCREVEVDFHRACLDEAIRAGQAVAARVLVCSPKPLALPAGVEHVPQEQGRFGERLAAALTAAFERGNGPVIIVGSDSPGLSAGHLAEAITLVADNPQRVVMGPSPDGGFYLLAAGRPIPHLACAARWCRRDTLASFCASLVGQDRPVALLDSLIDLDRRSDLERWLARFALRGLWRRTVRQLRSTLAAERRPPFLWSLSRSAHDRTVVASGRAPPRLVSS
jgi:glycosyltransferase A (GT-A) superfamily protein (DUF2064 family)